MEKKKEMSLDEIKKGLKMEIHPWTPEKAFNCSKSRNNIGHCPHGCGDIRRK